MDNIYYILYGVVLPCVCLCVQFMIPAEFLAQIFVSWAEISSAGTRIQFVNKNWNTGTRHILQMPENKHKHSWDSWHFVFCLLLYLKVFIQFQVLKNFQINTIHKSNLLRIKIIFLLWYHTALILQSEVRSFRDWPMRNEETQGHNYVNQGHIGHPK